MKIFIVVHGRFHAFDLARELIKSGQDVCVLTNYPKRVAERFGIPRERVTSNVLHGVVSRLFGFLGKLCDRSLLERFVHRWFSRWAARVIGRQESDVIHSFSGVSEELFLATAGQGTVRTLMRGSTHIEEQFEILSQEEERTGYRAYLPSEWMRQRELREYAAADYIIVLSAYAYDSFVKRGVPSSKLRILSLGSQLDLFRPDIKTIQARCDRIRSRERLRVLTVGTFSLRKGAWDYIAVAEALRGVCDFQFVGTVLRKASSLQTRARRLIDFQRKVGQHDLPKYYASADIFLFLTIEDGYAVVLAQALAAGLPMLATTNSAAPELVRTDETGWVLPIRSPELFIEKLWWCDQNRQQLATMVERSYQHFASCDWSDVARRFVEICRKLRERPAEVEQNVAGI